MSNDAGTDPDAVEPAIEPPEEAPRPPSSKAAIVIATLLAMAMLWAAQEIVLPVLLALFFALIGNPVIRLLGRLRIPRALAAILVLAGGIALMVVVSNQVAQPAVDWARTMPQQMAKVTPKLRALIKPVQDANRMAESLGKATGAVPASKQVQMVASDGSDPLSRVAKYAPHLVAQLLAVILLTLFFMIFGHTLERRAVELVPGKNQRRITVDILLSIEQEISRYVFTISIINVLLGLVLATCLHFFVGIDGQSALLWGTLATLLNYAPIVGPLIGVAVLLVMGIVTQPDLPHALIPGGIYLGLHLLEGEILTPVVLGKRMAISPLMLMIALLVFGWAWGIIGLLLAVPLLVCLKIVLSKLDGMEGWARLME
ncbi:AI-2E family transporter [Solilutibacter silvestris]|uniref:Putative permease n=1 Tax=Solilutibacter silvestris TaxID=1645665 RepID=A0A2K1Q257_9GAMM|nr:AI-2E family transporter [Lysobacter silvestris]PNS09126.1 putative permease [Lysobacter silvestris]